MKEIITNAVSLLDKKEPFAIATIVSHQGSTPRTSGSKMIITGDGQIKGTIGGGLLEARVMEKAVENIESGISSFLPFNLTSGDVASMDMICGGQANILIDQIRPDKETIHIFKLYKQTLDQNKKAFFLKRITGAEDQIQSTGHYLVYADGSVHGNLNGPADSAGEQLSLPDEWNEQTCNLTAMKLMEIPNGMLIIEPAVKPETAWLLGAGHVAQPTAAIAAMTGFHVSVADDRKEFANRERFPDAHDIRVLDSFDDAFSGCDIDEDSYIVIFTRGHLHDRTVLAQALRTKAGYIGMIGSSKKRNAIYRQLLDQGFEQKDIDRVHSPVGLEINAETPEEIAVSILAEMILEKRK